MQKKAITCTAKSSLSLAASKTDIPWSTYDYMDHAISFSDLGGITASIRIYPGEAGGNQYKVHGTTYTGDNQIDFFPYDSNGLIGLVVIFDAPFTGTVYFGSLRPFVKAE